MLSPPAASLVDEHPLELFLPADDWPLETGEPPTYVSFRHWPDGQVAVGLRAAQVPLPCAQKEQHSPLASAVAASQSQQ